MVPDGVGAAVPDGVDNSRTRALHSKPAEQQSRSIWLPYCSVTNRSTHLPELVLNHSNFLAMVPWDSCSVAVTTRRHVGSEGTVLDIVTDPPN